MCRVPLDICVCAPSPTSVDPYTPSPHSLYADLDFGRAFVIIFAFELPTSSQLSLFLRVIHYVGVFNLLQADYRQDGILGCHVLVACIVRRGFVFRSTSLGAWFHRYMCFELISSPLHSRRGPLTFVSSGVISLISPLHQIFHSLVLSNVHP